MSRQRKNAGAGYGYMFHGAFSKKADAVKKERKTKGAFIKTVAYSHGLRYAVMSPRTNPIKRKKKAKKETKGELLNRRLAELNAYESRGKNPSELLVMGANPHDHKELNLPAGSTITIRVNPEPNPYFGFGPSHPTKKELAASRRSFRAGVSRRVKEGRAEYTRLRKSARSSFKNKKKLEGLFHEVYGQNPAPICGAMIGGYQCTRKPGHRGPHLPQGATLRPRSRHKWGPRENPSAEAIRESFTGTGVDRVKIYDEPHMPAGDYALLGKLLALYVKPHAGGQVQMIRPTKTIAVVDETGRQIYFVGGDQDISSALHVFGAIDRGAGLYEIGEAKRIDYKQRKEHVPNPEVDEWRHDFGEESGVRPKVLFDAHAKRLLLEGGEYVIRTEGIVN